MSQQNYYREYGVEATLPFTLIQPDGVDFETGATFASGDLVIMKDEGAETNTDNLPTDEGIGYSQVLTATEMQAARIEVYVSDLTGPSTWWDDTLVIETYGHASAQHAFNLDTATQPVNLTQINGTAQRATDMAEIAQHLFANTATLTAILDDDSVIGQMLAKAAVMNYSRATDSRETLAEIAVSPAAVATAVWNELLAAHQSSGTSGRILSRVPDLFWNEIMETGASPGKRLAIEWMRLMTAALFGVTAGEGDWSAKSISETKTRISATLDADGNRTDVGTLDGS